MDLFTRLYNHGIPSGIVAGLILASWVKPVRLEGTVFLVLCTALVVWFTWVVVERITTTVSNRPQRAGRVPTDPPAAPPQASVAPTPAPVDGSTGLSVPRRDATTDAAMSPAAGPRAEPEDRSNSTQTQPENVTETVYPETPSPPAPNTADPDTREVPDSHVSQSRDA